MKLLTIISLFFFISLAQAEINVTMNHVGGDAEKPAGTIVVTESEHGLVFTPSLFGLEAGIHGFHLHENGSCEASTKDGKTTPAGKAGSHYDPKDTGQHLAPWENGHLGDLPALYVEAEGTVSTPVLAPRVNMDDLKGRVLMIHAGGDNYSDEPKKLGGGGARVACGVIAVD